MNNKKAVNIFKFHVVDKVGGTKTGWDQAIIFYDDGTTEIDTVENASLLAQENSLKVRNISMNKLIEEFDKYRQVKSVKSSPKKNSNNNKKPKAPKVNTSPKIKLSDTKNSDKKEEQIKKQRKFFNPFQKMYNMLEKVCDYGTKKLLRNNKKANKKQKTKNKMTSFIKKTYKRALAITTAAVIAMAGLGSCKNNKETVPNPKTIEETNNNLNNQSTDPVFDPVEIVDMNENNFEQLSFLELVNISTNQTQKLEMTKIGNYLDYFNSVFASKYLEDQKPNIKAALSWEEVMALNLVYNNLSQEEIIAMFNDYTIDSSDFINNYKKATLELIGAYVVQTRETPVKADLLVNTTEAKNYINKMNNLLLRIKETSGDNQVNAINTFYQQLYNDFLTNSTITDIQSYKFAITPMVAAVDMISKNLSFDHNIGDQVIQYFENIDLNQLVENKMNQMEVITAPKIYDVTNPEYQLFVDTKVSELEANGIYYSNDKNRDLSQLNSFQKYVDGYFNVSGYRNFIVEDNIFENIIYNEPTAEEIEQDRQKKEKKESQEQIIEQYQEDAAAYEERLKKRAQELADKINNSSTNNNQQPEETITDGSTNNDFIIEDNSNNNLDDEYTVVEDELSDTSSNFEEDYYDESSKVTDIGNGIIIEYEEPIAELGQNATNEQIANEIVEDMANQTSEEEVYVYTK